MVTERSWRSAGMKKIIALVFTMLTFAGPGMLVNAIQNIDQEYPLGKPGLKLTYSSKVNELPGSVVREFELTVGAVEIKNGIQYQWLQLNAEKENKQTFTIWILASNYPSESVEIAQDNISRYIISGNDSGPVEYVYQNHGTSILPATGAWKYLLPRTESSTDPVRSLENKVNYLGHEYVLDSQEQSGVPSPPGEPTVVNLNPEVMIGVPHNTRLKDETRRWDDSDYEYIKLTKEDYFEMIEAGINCFRADPVQVKWIETEDVYYWGIGGPNVAYPECLYKSNYIGPALFLDEPMVGTRDHVIRPKLREDPDLAKTLTPLKVFEEFKKVFHEKKYEEGPTHLLKELDKREDVDIGNIKFLQQNMYTWETMVSSAIYQLSEGDGAPPDAMVFEPPGRVGTRRILPELNMVFDCQIPADEPGNFTGIIYGFLRGAARVTGKNWGMSVYGQMLRSDAFWYMTHAYDLGATHFFFWDTHRLAAVPYNEYLALTRNLRSHAESFPDRNLEKLKFAAEVAILIPEFYNLGHVSMGIGNISALPALNMERINSQGVKYRDVMSNFLVEVERCIRLGVGYDLFWDLENLELSDYREIVNIREDGKIEITKNGESRLLDSARIPERPDGDPPQLAVEVISANSKPPFAITARAKVTEGSAPVYYTLGADKNGIYNNQYVLWELFGPEEEDHSKLWAERWDVSISDENNSAEVEIKFSIDKPGSYLLRAATTDVAGRSSVVWKNIKMEL
ncbi:MAG: hypothetical protein KAS82_03120 [Bacteroidales bacterium]|nr:hypothetical protein [Bacteroidales bacterium]